MSDSIIAMGATHEVFTPQGWKPITQVIPGESVVVLDPSNYVLDYCKIQEAYRAPYQGPMITLASTSARIVQYITPETPVLFYPDQYKPDMVKAEAFKVDTTSPRLLPVSASFKRSGELLTDTLRLLLALYASERRSQYTWKVDTLLQVDMLKDICNNLEIAYEEINDRVFTLELPENLKLQNSNIDTLGFIDLTNPSGLWVRHIFGFLKDWYDRYKTLPIKNEISLEKLKVCAAMSELSLSTPYWDKDNLHINKKSKHEAKDLYKRSDAYSGQVYGLSVKHGFVMTRYNGHISFVGCKRA